MANALSRKLAERAQRMKRDIAIDNLKQQTSNATDPILVRSYPTPCDFRNEALLLSSLGYRPTGQSGTERETLWGHTALKIFITGGLGLLSGPVRSRPQLHVTYALMEGN